MTDDAARDAALREEGRAEERADVLAWLRGGYARDGKVFRKWGNTWALEFEHGEHVTTRPTPDASQGSAPVVDGGTTK